MDKYIIYHKITIRIIVFLYELKNKMAFIVIDVFIIVLLCCWKDNNAVSPSPDCLTLSF